jgi:hypothetical protein
VFAQAVGKGLALVLRHRLGDEVAAFAVFDLDDPNVGIVTDLALDVGVEFALEIADYGLDPQAVAVGTEGFGVEARLAGQGVVGLDDDGSGPAVATADDGGRGALKPGAADQGADPQIAGYKHFANPAWKRDRNPESSKGRVMRIGQPRRYARACVITAVVAGLTAAMPMTALADATRPYFDRSFVLAANDKCRLFTPILAEALTSAALQAKGAAMRAGASAVDLAETASRAEARAGQTDCADPELLIVKDRVADAFTGWARTPRMTFPGTRAAWHGDRYALVGPGWRLKQTVMTGQSPVSFGLVGDEAKAQSLAAVISFVGQNRPYAARIVLRDADRAPRPWPADSGAGALPPETQRRVIFATSSEDAPESLREADRRTAQAWRFPEAAADLIAGLDPREAFAVEFLFSDDSLARATYEAGDFAAGRAFIDMGAL